MRQLEITGKNGEWEKELLVEDYGVKEGCLWVIVSSSPLHRKMFPLSAVSEITEKEAVGH